VATAPIPQRTGGALRYVHVGAAFLPLRVRHLSVGCLPQVPFQSPVIHGAIRDVAGCADISQAILGVSYGITAAIRRGIMDLRVMTGYSRITTTQAGRHARGHYSPRRLRDFKTCTRLLRPHAQGVQQNMGEKDRLAAGASIQGELERVSSGHQHVMVLLLRSAAAGTTHCKGDMRASVRGS